MLRQKIGLSFAMISILVLLVACGPSATPAPAPTTAPAAPAATRPPAVATAPAAVVATAAPVASADQGPCTSEAAGKTMPSGKQRLVIGTGGTGGVFYPYGGGLARILTAKMSNTEATAEVTGGSVDNLKLLQKGDADIGMTTVDSAYDSSQGTGSYKDTGKISACTIAVLYQSFVHVVVLDSAGINKVEDMKGKRVSVGSAGSSTEGAADRILEAAGLNPKSDIKRDSLSVQESVNAMKDQKIDAFFWIGGLPTAAVTDLVNTPNLKVKFLPADQYIDKMVAKYGPQYAKFALPKAIYKGLEADVPGIGIGNILVVNAKMPEQQVQNILKTIFDNLEEVKQIHPEAKSLSLASAAGSSSIPFHPGAIKFYTEKGVWKK